MKRGEVYYADLSPVVGCEQGGMRPVVIIQNDAGNTYANSVIVAPMTASYKKPMPTHVHIGQTDRMDSNTIILAEQIRTIDKSRVGKYVCRLHRETIEKMDQALKISLSLEKKGDEILNDFVTLESEKFGSVRLINRRDGKFWFSAKDVALALGYQKARDAVDQYVEKENQGKVKCISPEGSKDIAVINENGLHSLVLKAPTFLSEEFEKWILSEVHPGEKREDRENMNGLEVFENRELDLQVRTILNPDGSISVNAEDTAIGFGWTQEKNGKTYVKWERMNGFCKEFGFSPQVGKDDYLPESLFYRLGMKANNVVAEKFQNWLAMEVIPSIRKTGRYKQKRMSPEEMMRVQLGMIDGHEERISKSEERISKLEGIMNIDYGQQRVLEKEVAKTVIDFLGGKDSRAYQEMSKKVFAECNHDVKDYFHVNSRNNIPRIRFDDAVEYIRKWSPCTNTKAAIQEFNRDV